MTRTRRMMRALLVLAVLVGSLTLTTAGPSYPAGDGLFPMAEWRARQDDYLQWATESNAYNPGSVLSIQAHAERARRDPSFVWDPEPTGPELFQAQFDSIESLADTSDFKINNYLFLLAGYHDDIPADLAAAFENQVFTTKYWWTEPTPAGKIDSQYYWTENHQIIFLANEYIAGQLYPSTTFTNSGMSGADHFAHAESRIRSWIDHRARFGFSEWMSNVYYMEDMKGLLLLAEHADDDEIATLASMVLDVMFVEMASHTQNGAFGSTHGRSYMKDKMSALTEDNFTLSRMLFDDTAYPYQSVDNAVLLATANRYRPPNVVPRIARDERFRIVRQRQSLPIPTGNPVTANPVAPYGRTYQGEEGLMTWWGMGGYLTWPLAPLSVATIQQYDLWDTTNFQQAAALRPIVESSTIEQLQQLSADLDPALNVGLLSEANTYTLRAGDVMLSTAQCWRPGARSEQTHIWQATLDANAQVFTTHPRDGVPPAANPNSNDGYWTGNGTSPCSMQHRSVGISLYWPRYDPNALFDYEPYTHAYFPTEHFDQVVEQDGWVIGRLGDGYVALWSARPTQWRTYDPATEHTIGLTERFDLVAPGGPSNVWITEVSRADQWRGTPDPFQAFVDAITAAEITVTPDLSTMTATSSVPFSVQYDSPLQGAYELSGAVHPAQTRPTLTVDGAGVKTDRYPRHSTPWSQSRFDSGQYRVASGPWTLTLDFATASRVTTGP